MLNYRQVLSISEQMHQYARHVKVYKAGRNAYYIECVGRLTGCECAVYNMAGWEDFRREAQAVIAHYDRLHKEQDNG